MLKTSTTSPITARPSPPAVLGRTARRAGKGPTMIRARGRGSRLGGELPAEVDLRGRCLVVVVGAVRAAVQELDLDDVGASAGRSPRAELDRLVVERVEHRPVVHAVGSRSTGVPPSVIETFRRVERLPP